MTPVVSHAVDMLHAERESYLRAAAAIERAIGELKAIGVAPPTSQAPTGRTRKPPASVEPVDQADDDNPPPTPIKRRRPGIRPGSATYTLDQIAATAQEAWASGQAAEALIVTRHRISVSAARNAMTRARQKGILGHRPTGTTDPIGRTPFDPEQARMAAAEAL